MIDSSKYFDRDVSWLSFNRRVLMEAANTSVPLYERIKFLAIYSSNLDEFFRVRVAALRSIVDIDKKKINKRFTIKPKRLLQEVLDEVNLQQEEFGRIKKEMILPELKKNKIILYRNEPIIKEHKRAVEHYFKSKILSYLQPVIMTGEKSKAPYLDNRALYFAIFLEDKITGVVDYAHLNIPTNHLGRFVELPKTNDYFYYIAIDDIIRENLGFLFPNHMVKGCYSIKLNRDADLNIEDEYSGDLVKKIRKQIDKRNLGVPSRFLYDTTMPKELLEFLVKKFELEEDDLVPGGRYHNMYDLFNLQNPLKPVLENEYLEPITKACLEESPSVFNAIDQEDVMLHFPYHNYDYVLRFFNEAALDANVEEIKVTFYRIAPESFISNALISAANNGKHVTVFVEIKARFDEENNLKWAEKMERAGIKIIYSIPGLKVHAKVGLVCRRQMDGAIKRYGFFGTGNFNEKTATIYADEALLTCNSEMTEELDNVFEYLYKKEEVPHFNHLLVSQFNITDRLTAMIDQEIRHAMAGKKGLIILKLNNLQDDVMIDKLYEASQAGVKIELIIRAICCLRPGIKGLSENITVRRIVDRYLEHSRVFYFYNDGAENLYQGSADWMKRNLYRRIEVVFPVYKEGPKREIMKMLELQLKDNTKACLINEHLQNVLVENGESEIQAQVDFYTWLKAEESMSINEPGKIPLQ
ncbi:polyphosphate kinase 1 [Fulvivirga sp. 29W222]|uniref:Polyphosphate kinase n=1 Tax=Fulvivirga marina TaxID=2494733 RepID=A0A937KGR3_9BACT|nr:polyphosphate kinase 1 [Fulvivirga marina]MBL6449705.1 polyphosphate kinase 1 [Fulvivirga marina]